jgi:hypothetical protein
MHTVALKIAYILVELQYPPSLPQKMTKYQWTKSCGLSGGFLKRQS